MLGTVMFCSKILMEILPNIHLVGVLTVVYTVAFRKKALIPIYVYVLLSGLYSGFSMWWIPYIYIWTVLWGITMLLPKNMSKRAEYIAYPTVCALHGFAYGTLYSPAQALMFGFDLEQTVAWIISGLPFDIIHGVSNLFLGALVPSLAALLRRLMRRSYIQ